MLERLYYRLSEAEEILQTSREGLKRLERAGLIVMHGEHHGKRVTGASLRALADRLAAGEDIWAAARQSELRALQPMAKGRSTRTNKAAGGTSPQPKMDVDSLADAPLVSKEQSWLKRII